MLTAIAPLTWSQAAEPAREAVVYPGLSALPGLDQLRALLTGQAAAPPVARLSGRRIVDASFGSATYALPATGWVVGPKGVMHSGVLAFLADGALIAAVISALPPRVLCTTAELSMTFLGEPPLTGQDVVAHGALVHLDDEMGLAEVHLRDGNGRLVAHGTSRCSVFPAIADTVELSAPCAPRLTSASPDPFRRHAPAVGGAGHPMDRDGLSRLRGGFRGAPARPPIDQLTGIRLTSADPGRAVFAAPASPWLRNEWGTVYGGMLTLLAKSAAAAAVQTTAASDTAVTARDLKINFLRPVPVDGGDIVATGSVLHRGKRLAVATADVMHGGTRVAVLTGTTALAPG